MWEASRNGRGVVEVYDTAWRIWELVDQSHGVLEESNTTQLKAFSELLARTVGALVLEVQLTT